MTQRGWSNSADERRGWTAEDLQDEIRKFISEHGYSPSMRELVDGIEALTGSRPSVSTVYFALVHLAQNGQVTWVPRTPRTIRLKEGT